jgi:putative transposase
VISPTSGSAFGYRRLFALLRHVGEASGINRIYRLYREEGLTVRKRRARPILIEAKPNAHWSLGFVHDQFAAAAGSASSTSSTL